MPGGAAERFAQVRVGVEALDDCAGIVTLMKQAVHESIGLGPERLQLAPRLRARTFDPPLALTIENTSATSSPLSRRRVMWVVDHLQKTQFVTPLFGRTV